MERLGPLRRLDHERPGRVTATGLARPRLSESVGQGMLGKLLLDAATGLVTAIGLALLRLPWRQQANPRTIYLRPRDAREEDVSW